MKKQKKNENVPYTIKVAPPVIQAATSANPSMQLAQHNLQNNHSKTMSPPATVPATVLTVNAARAPASMLSSPLILLEDQSALHSPDCASSTYQMPKFPSAVDRKEH